MRVCIDINFMYQRHGMICVSKTFDTIELLLFGTCNSGPIPFYDTFIKIKININIVRNEMNINEADINEYFNITQEKIEVKCKNANRFNKENGWFAYNTIVNHKKERVIIVFGADLNEYSKSIILFNCNTNELLIKNYENLYFDWHTPSTIIHNDHIHVISTDNHLLINLRKLLNEFDMNYSDLYSSFFWEQE